MDNQHRSDIDDYLHDLISVLETSTQKNIPYTKQKTIKPGAKKRIIPGWTEQIKPHKESARFHYQLWLCGGKPREGPLYQNMCKSRNQFRYAKRMCINAAETINRTNLTDAILSGGQEIFSEMKKMRGGSKDGSTRIDGFTDNLEIADHLKSQYEALYNRTGSSEPLKNLLTEVNDDISQDLSLIHIWRCRRRG